MKIGLTLRNQPYGIDFDAAVAATKVDVAEGEVRVLAKLILPMNHTYSSVTV